MDAEIPVLSPQPSSFSRGRSKIGVLVIILGVVLAIVGVGAVLYVFSPPLQLRVQEISFSLLPTPKPQLEPQNKLWTVQESVDFMRNRLNITAPEGWNRIECANYVFLNPPGALSTCDEREDITVYAISIRVNTPDFFRKMLSNADAQVTDRQQLTIARYPAEQFNYRIDAGADSVDFLQTAIFVDDAAVFVTLYQRGQLEIYQNLLQTLQIR